MQYDDRNDEYDIFWCQVHISFYYGFSSIMQLHQIVKKTGGIREYGGMDKPNSLLMMTNQNWPLQMEWHFIDNTWIGYYILFSIYKLHVFISNCYLPHLTCTLPWWGHERLSAHQILALVFGYDQTIMRIYGSLGLE